MVITIKLVAKYTLPALYIYIVLPVGHSWVTGISWNGLVILSYEQWVNFKIIFHETKLSLAHT
jgi:hypothetical protein